MVRALQSITRCRRNYVPFKIAPKYARTTTIEDYIIFDEQHTPIGRFSIGDTGLISNFSIVERVRRTPTAANAILSLRDFIENKSTNEQKFLFFISDKTKTHLKRMYQKLGAIFVGEEDNKFFYTIPQAPSEKLVEETTKIIQQLKRMQAK